MPYASPTDIQNRLNQMSYNGSERFRCPANVERDATANCTEGAFFAAAELARLGLDAYIVVMLAENDDDHLIAAYRRGDRWGAVAKSNTSVLRAREPVYASVRELVMSYFDMYFNTIREKSLRRYSDPLPIGLFDAFLNEDDADYWPILDNAPYHDLLTPEMIAALEPVDPELHALCFALSDPDGLYRPKPKDPP